jgi:hypothetical protein
MGSVGAAAAGDGPMALTVEMGKSIMLRLNRSDQRMSQFQTQVQASLAQLSDRLDHNFMAINNNISLLTQQANNGRQLGRVGKALPA